MNDELIRRLRAAAVVLENLPELPDYNGSILLIDDVEAERIAKDIDAVADALAAMQIRKE
jgi:hypothetical protein